MAQWIRRCKTSFFGKPLHPNEALELGGSSHVGVKIFSHILIFYYFEGAENVESGLRFQKCLGQAPKLSQSGYNGLYESAV